MNRGFFVSAGLTAGRLGLSDDPYGLIGISLPAIEDRGRVHRLSNRYFHVFYLRGEAWDGVL